MQESERSSEHGLVFGWMCGASRCAATRTDVAPRRFVVARESKGAISTQVEDPAATWVPGCDLLRVRRGEAAPDAWHAVVESARSFARTLDREARRESFKRRALQRDVRFTSAGGPFINCERCDEDYADETPRETRRKNPGGIVLHRVGGLSAVRQRNDRAPARRGVWAFIWPYFDRSYLYIAGRSRVPEMKRDGKRVFLHRGPLWTHLEVPGWTRRVQADDGSLWYLVDADRLAAHLPRARAQDAEFRRKAGGPRVSRLGPRADAPTSPWVDHYEVFVPRPTSGEAEIGKATRQAKRGARSTRRANPPPTDDLCARTWYHGVSREEWARGVLTKGLLPLDVTLVKKLPPRGATTPVQGRVYITDRIAYAQIYAIGGNYAGTSASAEHLRGHYDKPGLRYGYVFAFDGKDLCDVEPDEDVVGYAVYQAHRLVERGHDILQHLEVSDWPDVPRFLASDPALAYDLLGHATRHVTEHQFKGLKRGDYRYWASAGKRLIPKLPVEWRLRLIRWGGNVAHGTPLHPRAAWRIDKLRMGELRRDGSNFFEIAEPLSLSRSSR